MTAFPPPSGSGYAAMSKVLFALETTLNFRAGSSTTVGTLLVISFHQYTHKCTLQLLCSTLRAKSTVSISISLLTFMVS